MVMRWSDVGLLPRVRNVLSMFIISRVRYVEEFPGKTYSFFKLLDRCIDICRVLLPYPFTYSNRSQGATVTSCFLFMPAMGKPVGLLGFISPVFCQLSRLMTKGKMRGEGVIEEKE
jgi:hypothetical protein